MNTVDQLLFELQQRGFSLWLEGDRLRYRATKEALSPDLRTRLQEKKPEIIAFLRQANASTTSQLPPIESIDRSKPLPLSFGQQRLWLLHQLEPDSTSNNMPVVVRFTGTLDIPRLEQSIQAVVQRQEVLRTRFPSINGQPTLVIEDKVNITLPVVDLRELPAAERDAEAFHLATQEARHPFDLANGPILRVKLFQLKNDEHLLIWNMHCIVCDGASSDVFYQDLTTIYKSLVTGEPAPLSDLPLQYVDFAHWQKQWLQGDILESQLGYWKKNLEGNLPVLQLPLDHRRPVGVQSYRGDRGPRMLPITLNEALSHLSQQLGGTLFMTLLAAFEVLLYRYSGQEDVLISFASAGRGQVETERLVGFFSNTLVLRTDFSGNPTFRELFNRVKEASLQAYAHQDIPFEKLIEELRPEQSQMRSPLFQVKFALNPPWSKGRGMASVHLPDLTITSLFGYIYHGKTKYDLTLVMREQDEGLGMVFDYNAEIFDADTIARMLEHFQILLEGIVANPDQRISDLPLLAPVEKRQLLVDWNPPLLHAQSTSIPERFEDQVKQSPEAIALVTGEQSLRYGTLNEQANQLARYLQSLGVVPGTQIGLYFNRSTAAIISILAVLKTGATFVPLSLEALPACTTKILTDAQTQWVLTERKLMDGLAEYPEKILCWEDMQSALPQYGVERLANEISPEQIAYILYPSYAVDKGQALQGVSIRHSSVIEAVTHALQLHLSSEDVLLAFAPLSSEIAIFELFSALLQGCKLAIWPENLPLQQLGAFIQAQQVTTLWLPTRLFHHLVEQQLEHCTTVRNLFIGGDVLSNAHVQQFKTAVPNCAVFNTYSFPENTAFTCYYPIPESIPDNLPSLMGQPTQNTQIYVLDKHLQPLPMGAVGELYLSGTGLAQGYFNQPEETAKRFIDNPFDSDSASRLFKTNHLVRFLPGGTLELKGRSDQQVMVRECRTDLGEIESTLSQHPTLQQCVVISRRDNESQDPYLVAYLTTTGSEAPDAFELRQFLQKHLPDYMIPAAFIKLESLPLTRNGEIDPRALPQPDASDLQASNRYVAPRTPLEQQLANVWCRIFKMEQISIHDNFFNLGGHSILAMSLFREVEESLQKQLPLAVLYQLTTIAEMANFLEQEETGLHLLDPSDDDLPPIDEEVLRALLTVVAGRQGAKTRPDSLITSMRTTGSKPPLFFCANRLLELSTIASYLSEEQPVYFAAVGIYVLTDLSRERGVKNLKAIAARHVRDMLIIQPEGPYLVAGYCFGATMAYEIAQQLQAKGKQVIFLGVVDNEGVGRRYRHYMNEVEPLLVEMKQSLSRESLTRFALKIREALGAIKDNFFSTKIIPPESLEDVVMQNYPGQVTLFLPKDAVSAESESRYGKKFRQFLFPKVGWEEHSVKLVSVPGNHLTIVYGSGAYNHVAEGDRPADCYHDVQVMAAKLEAEIDAALAIHRQTT
jgi:amino acid adenylation domain-containing protein